MKICLISTWPPMQCGIGDFTYEIVKFMHKEHKDIDIYVITYSHNNLNQLSSDYDNIKVFKILRKNGVILNIIHLIRVLKKLKPDIIHLHISYYLFPQIVLLTVIWYCIFYKCKLILTIHDVLPKKFFCN